MKESSQAHRDEATAKLSPMGKRFFSLIEFDDKEELFLEIRKHPFGLFLIEIAGFSIAALLGLIPLLIAFNLDVVTGNSAASASFQPLLILVGAVFALLAIGATFLSAIVYTNNVIYVTSDKIAQVVYTSIFSRKISQLSIGDVQDVTVTQKGIFPRAFGYGTLVIETAGEQQNYTFSYVPEPYKCAREIVGAHERNLVKHGN
jgi:uncharacterized membrane protein YdbT with pleckstrin-like domain